jgi:hypothetical protein
VKNVSAFANESSWTTSTNVLSPLLHKETNGAALEALMCRLWNERLLSYRRNILHVKEQALDHAGFRGMKYRIRSRSSGGRIGAIVKWTEADACGGAKEAGSTWLATAFCFQR